MIMKEATPFDVSEYLDSDEKIAAYLSAILEDNDTNLLITAIGHVARAKGMAQIAKESGLGRESLYKSFVENSQPKFDTVLRVLRAMGIALNFSPTENIRKEQKEKINRTRKRIGSPKKAINSIA